MKVRNIVLTAGALLLGMVGTFVALKAQGALYDKVIVDLPYTVTVRDTTLEPGQYVIQQFAGESSSQVVQILGNNGMKLETTVITIPALDNNTPDKTEVTLHHLGNDYYFDKVWIQGKNYGYEFPLPKEVKSREGESGAPVTVGARYESSPGGKIAAAQPTPAPASSATEQESTTAPASQQPPASQSSATAQDPEAQLPASTEAAGRERASGEQMAQAQPQPLAPSDDAPSATRSAETGSRNREMPKTASNWFAMLLTGCALAATGIALRRATA